jgi:long-chain fatty acid transport protein
MTLFNRFVSILVMLSVVTIVAFGGGFQLNEHGARSMAQGGAFAGRALDGSAIYFNPAGLSFQKGTSFYVGTTLIATAGKYISTGSITTEQIKGAFFPTNAYITHTMDNGLAFGIGFFSPYGLGTEWPNPWAGDTLAVETNLKTFYLNPTISYKFSDKLSIAVGASYVWSDVSLNYRVATLASLQPLTPTKGTAELTGKGTSWNWNVGIMYKPAADWYIGASYRGQTKVDYSGDVKFTGMGIFGNLGGVNYFPGGYGKTSITMPSNLFVGIAHDFTSNLTIETDFQYIGWSSYDELVLDIATGPTIPNAPSIFGPLAGMTPQKSPAPKVKAWENAFMVRLGGEYRLDPLALRAGFIYDKTPQPINKIEPMLPDANRVEFTVGLGFKLFSVLGVDLAYQAILFQERTATTPDNGFKGTYDSNANLFGLNLSYGI